MIVPIRCLADELGVPIRPKEKKVKKENRHVSGFLESETSARVSEEFLLGLHF